MGTNDLAFGPGDHEVEWIEAVLKGEMCENRGKYSYPCWYFWKCKSVCAIMQKAVNDCGEMTFL
jgi:hypothetical protein